MSLYFVINCYGMWKVRKVCGFVPDRIAIELKNRLHVLVQIHVICQGNVCVMGGVEVCDTAGGDA